MNIIKMSDNFPDTELCSLKIEGNTARLNLTRSSVFNALNTQLITELINIISGQLFEVYQLIPH